MQMRGGVCVTISQPEHVEFDPIWEHLRSLMDAVQDNVLYFCRFYLQETHQVLTVKMREISLHDWERETKSIESIIKYTQILPHSLGSFSEEKDFARPLLQLWKSISPILDHFSLCHLWKNKTKHSQQRSGLQGYRWEWCY